MIRQLCILTKWLTVGMGIKRWLLLMLIGIFLTSIGLSYLIIGLQSADTAFLAADHFVCRGGPLRYPICFAETCQTIT